MTGSDAENRRGPGGPRPLSDTGAGGVDQALGDLRDDVDVLRAELAAQIIFAQEMMHRNRNLLAVVSVLIRKTLAEVTDLDAARAALDDLTARLAAGHDMDDAGQAPGFRRSVERTLAPFETRLGQQIEVQGPPVVLLPEADRKMALVIYELATNAVKHGALRTLQGHVTVNWTCEADGGLRFDWTETAAAPIGEGSRVGGGSQLFAAIEADLGAEVTVDVVPEGFRATVVLPARHVADDGTARPEGAGEVRVLIVEDNVLIASDLGDILTTMGVAGVELAFSEAEARTILQSRRFDAVILDVSLGETLSDGLLALTQGARVVVVSGRARAELPPALAQLPLVGKPFQPSDLAAVLEGLVARRVV